MKIIINDGNLHQEARVTSSDELVALIYEGAPFTSQVQTVLHAMARDLAAFAKAEACGLWVEIDVDDAQAHAWLQGALTGYRFESDRGWRSYSEDKRLGKPRSLEMVCAFERGKLPKAFVNYHPTDNALAR
jgi:hypothetical protein